MINATQLDRPAAPPASQVRLALAPPRWDALVIGGGIAGVAIMRELARRGLTVLLVERNDFASGTSSRSSKLVHGGLRYLARLQIRIAAESIRERRRLLRVGRHLVEPLRFRLVIPSDGTGPRPWQYAAVLALYEALGGSFRMVRRTGGEEWEGETRPHAPAGTFAYGEATTDDARLVLRVLREGERWGGRALNYVAAESLLRDQHGRVVGARLRTSAGECTEVRARVVINATGPWTDELRVQVGAPRRMRLVRGSHLVISRRRLPLKHAVATMDGGTGQPVYVFPWNGVTLVGSTAVEQSGLDTYPAITPDELALLLQGANALFPTLGLRRRDIQATFSGVRPIAAGGDADPVRVSREDVVWEEDGLVTVSGGKLTTYQAMALRVVETLRARSLPELGQSPGSDFDACDPLDLPVRHSASDPPSPFAPEDAARLAARYGIPAVHQMADFSPEERGPVPGDRTLWCELRWAAREEKVQHLEDLLLRRTRLGLTLPLGGESVLPRLRRIVAQELDWSDTRWREEIDAYRHVWTMSHAVPPGRRSRGIS